MSPDRIKSAFERHFSSSGPGTAGYRGTNEMKNWSGTTEVVA